MMRQAPALPGAGASSLRLRAPERLARRRRVVDPEHDPASAEGRVRELDICLRAGELAGYLAQRAGPVLDVDDEHVALVRHLDTCARQRVARRPGVLDEDVDHAAPLARVSAHPLD